MRVNDELFGELEYDDYDGFQKKITVDFGGEREIDLVLSEMYFDGDGIQGGHRKAYEKLLAEWDTVTAEVLDAIVKYQNDEWGSTDHTASFPRFTSKEDALANTELLSVQIEAHPPQYIGRDGRYVIFTFSAEWVNNDYRLLSVALLDEKVIEVTDEDI